MSKLTSESYWDHFWKASYVSPARLAGVKRWFKKAIGPERLSIFTSDYADEAFHERVFRGQIRPTPETKLVEIGSAPGAYLVKLRDLFHLDPYGVDNSLVGVERNREVFQANQIDPGHVVFADAFAAEYFERYAAHFDVVMSRGVLEHFEEPVPIVARHARLVRPGGWLVVSIPNFQGVNLALKRLMSGHNLPEHNLRLMEEVEFRRTFDAGLAGLGFTTVFCGYFGTCKLAMSYPVYRPLWKPVFQVLDKMQVLLNGILRSKYGLTGGPESWYLSPSLLYLGRKDLGSAA